MQYKGLCAYEKTSLNNKFGNLTIFVSKPVKGLIQKSLVQLKTNNYRVAILNFKTMDKSRNEREIKYPCTYAVYAFKRNVHSGFYNNTVL